MPSFLGYADALTALGHGEQAWEALLAGHSGLVEASQIFPDYERLGSGVVGALDGLPCEGRLPLLFARIRETILPACARHCDFLVAASSLGDLTGAYAGLPERFLQSRLRELFPELRPERCVLVSSACSSGTDALSTAHLLVENGIAEVVGVLAFDTLEGGKLLQHVALGTQSRARIQPFDVHRSGTSFGEGAAFVIVAGHSGLRRINREPLARLMSFGMSCDALDITAPDPTGTWPVAAIRRALDAAGSESARIGYVNAHGSGTRLNDQIEGMALRAALGARVDGIPVSSTKGAVGHLLGATGLVEVVFTARALRDGVCPGNTGLVEADPLVGLRLLPTEQLDVGKLQAALSVTFGFGGVNSAVVLAQA